MREVSGLGIDQLESVRAWEIETHFTVSELWAGREAARKKSGFLFLLLLFESFFEEYFRLQPG